LLLMLAVLARNALARGGWRRAPWLIALVGAALNLVVICANGGYMPVDTTAFESTGAAAQAAERPRYRRDVPGIPETRFVYMSDILPPPEWQPPRSVISVGDMLLVVGLSAWLVGSALTQPTRRYGRAAGACGH